MPAGVSTSTQVGRAVSGQVLVMEPVGIATLLWKNTSPWMPCWDVPGRFQDRGLPKPSAAAPASKLPLKVLFETALLSLGPTMSFPVTITPADEVVTVLPRRCCCRNPPE